MPHYECLAFKSSFHGISWKQGSQKFLFSTWNRAPVGGPPTVWLAVGGISWLQFPFHPFSAVFVDGPKRLQLPRGWDTQGSEDCSHFHETKARFDCSLLSCAYFCFWITVDLTTTLFTAWYSLAVFTIFVPSHGLWVPECWSKMLFMESLLLI